MARGTYAPALAVTETNSDSTQAAVLFTGTRAAPSWPRLALHQLARLRRPPVPAPFYLATAAITVDLGELSR